MSIGGASFDLGIGLSKFEGDLARAREIAEAASRQINAALSGAGQGINGNGLSQSLAQANGAIEQTIQAVRQESVATAQAIQTVAAASEQASARAVAGTRELLNAQRALNTLVTGVGRSETVETGAGQVAAAYEAARESVERLKAADPAGALTAINRASAAARGGIDELNLSIARLAAGGAAGGGGGYAELLAEYERLVSLGKTIPDEMAKAIGDIVNDPNLLNEEDASVKQMLAENAQAKSLTAALGSLETARKQLTVADDQGTQAATRSTAAEREQARQADLLRQQQAQVARAQQSTQAVAANPDLALAANAKNILQGAGLDADAATKSVNQLQGAINAANRALAVKDVAVGFDQATAGADALRAALAALAGGNIQAGIDAEAAATGAFARALVETRAAAAAVVEELRAENLTLEQQRALQTELAAINSRSSAIQAAIVGAERAAATTTSAVRDALGAVEQGGVSAATTIRNLGVGVENLGSAMGDSRIGQFSGAIGRIGSLLESAGITSGVAATLGLVAAIAALGAGLAATIKQGLAFDSFLEDTRVRLEGATGSAKAAQQALDDIQQKAVAPQFRAFSTQDLAQGIEVLRRMGDQSEATQKRIADVAAETGQTFAQTAEQIGAISERIKGGLPLDDTLQSLVRAGVLTADYAAKLKIAQANGVDAATQLAIFNEGLDRFSGTAEKAGRTATGSFQAAKNALGELAGLALAPEFDTLARAVNGLADALGNPKFREGVEILGKVVALGAAAQPLALIPVVASKIADRIHPQQQDTPPAPTSGPAPEQLLQQSYQQAQAAYDAGRKAIEQYTQGFDEGSAKAFSDISDQVEKGLTALSGGKLSEAMQQKLEGVIEPLIAKAVDEIQRYGAVQAETTQAIVANFGSQADAVLKLATDYAGLRDAEQQAADAAKALASAQQLQSYHQQVAQDISAIDQQAIDDATKQQKADDAHFDGIIAGQKKIADGWQQLGQIFHDSYQQALDAMDAQIRADERANQDAANSARDQIQGKQDDLSDYQDTVARRRQDAQDQIRGLQGELSDYQDQINARRQQAQDALQAQRDALTQLQAQAQAAQQALSDHQAAFQAAIGGTVDLFNQEHTQQDEITRAIIAKWQAEIDGSRRAKDEADQKVRADTEHEHELTLAYDKRIQAARDAGRVAEAASLTRERDRVLAQQQQAGQVNRDEAAVAGDKLQDRVDAANRAARGQQSTDQVAVNNANALVTAAQAALDDATKLEAAKERAEDEEVKRRKATLDAATTLEQEKERDEDSEVKRRQAEITHLDRVESARARAASLAITDEKDRRDALAQQQKDSDAFYQGAADNINKILIPAIEEQKAKQHAADQQRIDDAKTIKDADDLYWKDRKTADDNAVTAAAAIKKSADDAVTAYQHQIDALKEINSQLNDANTKELAYLNGLRAVLGLTPLTALPGDDPNLPNDPTRPGASTPATAPKAPPPGAPAPAQPVPAAAPPAPPPASKPPVYDPSTALGGPPPGYHSEYAYDGKQYYVRDGYHLEDYGVAQGSPPAQTAPPNPSDPGLTAGVGALNFARASLAGVGGGGGQLAALSTGPIAPIPGYAGIAAGAGARARDIGHLAGRRWEVAPAGPVNVHLFANSTINASDPADVDGMLDKMGDAFFGTGIAGLEIAKRAGTYPGRWGGSGA